MSVHSRECVRLSGLATATAGQRRKVPMPTARVSVSTNVVSVGDGGHSSPPSTFALALEAQMASGTTRRIQREKDGGEAAASSNSRARQHLHTSVCSRTHSLRHTNNIDRELQRDTRGGAHGEQGDGGWRASSGERGREGPTPTVEETEGGGEGGGYAGDRVGVREMAGRNADRLWFASKRKGRVKIHASARAHTKRGRRSLWSDTRPRSRKPQTRRSPPSSTEDEHRRRGRSVRQRSVPATAATERHSRKARNE